MYYDNGWVSGMVACELPAVGCEDWGKPDVSPEYFGEFIGRVENEIDNREAIERLMKRGILEGI